MMFSARCMIEAENFIAGVEVLVIAREAVV
jgi:hypothetical protein